MTARYKSVEFRRGEGFRETICNHLAGLNVWSDDVVVVDFLANVTRGVNGVAVLRRRATIVLAPSLAARAQGYRHLRWRSATGIRTGKRASRARPAGGRSARIA